MQHRQIRSNRPRIRYRETSPVRSLSAPAGPKPIPGSCEASSSFHQPRHKGERGASRKPSLGGLQEASFLRQAQDQALAEQTPLRQLAVEEGTSQTTSLAEQNLPKRQALEGRTSQKRHREHPPPQQEQLDLAQLEHMMLKIDMLQKVVRKLVRGKLPPTLAAELAEDDCKQDSDNNNNNNNNNKQQPPHTTTTTTTMSPTTTTTTTKTVKSLA